MKNAEIYPQSTPTNASHDVEKTFEAIQGKAIKAFDESKRLTSDAVDRSVQLAKKYPVHSALSAGAVRPHRRINLRESD